MISKIESGIPMPTRRAPTTPYGAQKRLIASMAVGDSVLIPVSGDSEDARRRAMSVYRTALRIGVRITYRTQEGGIRVWRSA